MKIGKSAALILSILLFVTAAPAQPVSAGNAEETPGCQLQTILIDNDGKNLWTTESWGGANILPNTSWTTTDAYDYYYNGTLSFEAKSNGTEPLSFWIGLSSRRHAETVSLYWTDLEQYKGKMTAGTAWTAYTLPIKELLDANPDSGFSSLLFTKPSLFQSEVGRDGTGTTTPISSAGSLFLNKPRKKFTIASKIFIFSFCYFSFAVTSRRFCISVA